MLARVGVSLVFVVCGALFGTWASRVAAVADRLGLDAGSVTVALVGLAVGSVLALIGAGALITNVGSRVGVLIGVSVECSALLLLPLASDTVVLTALLVGFGAGNSLLDVSMNAHAARVERAYGRPIYAGFHAFWNVGGLVAAGIGALFAGQGVGVEVHFPVVALVMAGLGWWAAWALLLRGDDDGQGSTAFSLPSKALLPLGVIAFCAFVAEGAVNDWSAIYLHDVDHAAAGLVPLGYFTFSVAMLVVRSVSDRIVARTGAAWLLRLAAIVTVLGFGVLLTATTTAFGVLGFGLVGIGLSSMVPLAWSAAGWAQPDNPGHAITAVATAGYLGFLVGPAVVGGLASAFGLRAALLSVVFTAGTVLALARAAEPARPRTPAFRNGSSPRSSRRRAR